MIGSRTLLALAFASASVAAQSDRLPASLGDREFWALSQSLSEPGGYFQSENYVSNEQLMQVVIPRFASISSAASRVYLGVGPEQNYTYIAAMRPQIAFILDIRRGNLLEHLMYKALFELSTDRADFLSRLLSRPRPDGLVRTSSIDVITERLSAKKPDRAMFRANRAAIFDVLMRKHAFALGVVDTLQISGIFDMFMRGGLEITYLYPRANTRQDPDLWDLLVARDRAGVQRSFLASDSAFRYVKDMHARNMIVPVMGDFAGPKALRAIGAWVRERRALVGAFYVSNVEQYLFQKTRSHLFYENVKTLPTDSTSLFVRSIASNYYRIVYPTGGGGVGMGVYRGPPLPTNARAARQRTTPLGRMIEGPTHLGFFSYTSGIKRTLALIPQGKLQSYNDVIRWAK